MSYERKNPYFYRYWKKSTIKKPEQPDGDAIAFTPKNEMNVREVFAQRAGRLGYRILESRIPFPDYILESGRKRILAEAEFRTSDFLRHKHDLTRCDLIVVWEHDLGYMPVPVLELKTEEVHRPRRGRPPRQLWRSNTWYRQKSHEEEGPQNE
jgi:hypothetical protein